MKAWCLIIDQTPSPQSESICYRVLIRSAVVSVGVSFNFIVFTSKVAKYVRAINVTGLFVFGGPGRTSLTFPSWFNQLFCAGLPASLKCFTSLIERQSDEDELKPKHVTEVSFSKCHVQLIKCASWSSEY